MLPKNLVLCPLPGAYSPVSGCLRGWMTYTLSVRANMPRMSGAGGKISAEDPWPGPGSHLEMIGQVFSSVFAGTGGESS